MNRVSGIAHGVPRYQSDCHIMQSVIGFESAVFSLEVKQCCPGCVGCFVSHLSMTNTSGVPGVGDGCGGLGLPEEQIDIEVDNIPPYIHISIITTV